MFGQKKKVWRLSFGFYKATALYILHTFALQHPCRISVIFLLQCYCLVKERMNPCGKISCLYVCVHIVYKMGYTFVN